MKLVVQDNGDIAIEMAQDDLDEVEQSKARASHLDHDVLADLLELSGDWPGGQYIPVRPEQVPGALTDAPMFTDEVSFASGDDDAEYTATGNVWWYPDYMVKNFVDELVESGRTVFTKARAA